MYFLPHHRQKRNQIEAEKVIQLLRELWMGLDDQDRPSIGIVTFSAEQQDAIWDEVDKECSNDRQFSKIYEKELSRKNGEEDIGFFVRNIENVQGDERDIIIFTVGYAPDTQGGEMKMRFGTFSREKGENRLNVAITRAKKEVHIVASIEPGEMRVESTTNLGPKMLQQYLRYCRLVDSGDNDSVKEFIHRLSSTLQPDDGEVFGSDFESEVYDFLTKKGFKLKKQVGCSSYKIDLAIIDPAYDGKYLCGIECDGATYHSSKDARERDIYRQSYLEDKGWKILRIWSSTWFHQRKIAEEKLLGQINALIKDSETKMKVSEEFYEEFKKKRADNLTKISNEKLQLKKVEKNNSRQNDLFSSNSKQTVYTADDNNNNKKDSIFEKCPECGGRFRAVDGYAEPKLKCVDCSLVKDASFDILKTIARDDVSCPRHINRILKVDKGRMGVFMKCDYPKCNYISDVKIKQEFKTK